MMEKILVLAVLFPLPAMSGDLSCMPDRVCVRGSCTTDVTADSAIRITHPNSMAPMLFSQEEAITLQKAMQQRGYSLWTGTNAMGEELFVDVQTDQMSFRYHVGGAALLYAAFGQCVEE
jgi:hypothetical protein